MSLQVAATPPKTVLVYTDFCLMQNTDVFGRLKWSWPEWSGPTEPSFLCSAHFEQTCFERGLHSQFGIAYKAMLLPDEIPTIFPLSKKVVKGGAFLKRERLRVSGHLVILSCITQSTSVQKRHVHTMLTFSVFAAWKHAVIFHINKTSCLFLYPGKTSIKTLMPELVLSFFKWSELWLNSFCYFIK